jgi:hypothetical protein
MMKLSSKPTRHDLTDRECAKLLGGLIGGLCAASDDVDAVRRAVRWWAANDDAWRLLAGVGEDITELLLRKMGAPS